MTEDETFRLLKRSTYEQLDKALDEYIESCSHKPVQFSRERIDEIKTEHGWTQEEFLFRFFK